MILSNYQKNNKIYRFLFYKNIHQFSTIKLRSAVLFYLADLKKHISLNIFAKFFCFLEVITSFRGVFIFLKNYSTFTNLKKGSPVGVKITLKKKSLDLFYSYFVWGILPKITDCINLRKSCENQKKIMLFFVKNPFIFLEMKKYYFYFKNCLGLKILFCFSKRSNSLESYFLARFFCLS